MFLLIVFYLKSFPHEVQVVICNLRNLYHKIISIPVAMYELNMDYWEMQVRELFCDKCKSWLVTRSDLVSHHTSTHKVGRQYQERLGYWLRICHGILFTLNISVMGKRSLMITKNKLDSHQSSTHGIVNYSFVSMGENPTVRLFFLSFIFTFCWYFLSKLITVSRNKRWDRHLWNYIMSKNTKIFFDSFYHSSSFSS